jgi:acyl-CoA dehydrogenase
MMNLERIVVGIQGLGISEIAYQNALNYSKERKQGKSNNSKTKNNADIIIEHADIRRSLLNMKSMIEGERALSFWLAQQTEVSLYHNDAKVKQQASDLVSLMTPVVKSLFTDMGMEITSDAMQIFGGYGYTKDQGIEQLYRDNRITPIYEGTNSVQAIDLVFRKLVNKNGNIIENYTQLVKKGIDESKNNTETKIFAEKLNQYLQILIDFTVWIEKSMKNSKDDVSAACNDYLKVLGLIAVGYSWLKVLDISYKEIQNNKNFFEDKIETAKFFFDRILPRIDTHYKSGISGSKNIMNFKFN